MKDKEKNPRLGVVGGQAVIEGVMMKHKDAYAIAVRRLDGNIDTKKFPYKSLRQKNKFFRIPIIRGIVNFVEMLKLSYGTLNSATEMLGFEEEEETKFEKWLKKHFGASIMNFVMGISVVFALLLSVFLFIFLPTAGGKAVDNLVALGWAKPLVEGGIRIVILVGYMFLCSLVPDMKRVFQYHGSEHKSIFCYESGAELTVENVKKQSRFHPRCGTSFMFALVFVSIIVSFFITFSNVWLRTLCKILLAPLIIGIGYEFIMYAGKHDNLFVKIVSAPGLWMQRITTKEPDEKQIEVAIVSLKTAMPEEFPDFVPPVYKEAEAEKKEEALQDEVKNGEVEKEA